MHAQAHHNNNNNNNNNNSSNNRNHNSRERGTLSQIDFDVPLPSQCSGT